MVNYVVIDDFISSDTTKSLIKDIEQFDNSALPIIHGGRSILTSSKPIFSDLMESSSYWRELYTKFSDSTFFDFCCNQLDFKEHYKKRFYLTRFFNHYSTDLSKKIRRVNQRPCNIISTPTLLLLAFSRLIKHCYFILKYLPQRIGLGGYPTELLFAYSCSKNGYYNSIHRDTDNRVIVFLLFLNSLDEKGSGGNLDFYKYMEDQSEIPSTPEAEKCLKIESIEPKPGRLVIFENTADALHGVDIMKDRKEGRHFCYGSFTCLSGPTPRLKNYTREKLATEFFLDM